MRRVWFIRNSITTTICFLTLWEPASCTEPYFALSLGQIYGMASSEMDGLYFYRSFHDPFLSSLRLQMKIKEFFL